MSSQLDEDLFVNRIRVVSSDNFVAGFAFNGQNGLNFDAPIYTEEKEEKLEKKHLIELPGLSYISVGNNKDSCINQHIFQPLEFLICCKGSHYWHCDLT